MNTQIILIQPYFLVFAQEQTPVICQRGAERLQALVAENPQLDDSTIVVTEATPD